MGPTIQEPCIRRGASTSVYILDFYFKTAKQLGQQVIDAGENDKKHEAQNASNERPEDVNNSNNPDLVVAENGHWNTD